MCVVFPATAMGTELQNAPVGRIRQPILLYGFEDLLALSVDEAMLVLSLTSLLSSLWLRLSRGPVTAKVTLAEMSCKNRTVDRKVMLH